MGRSRRTSLRTAAVVTVAALFTGATATAAYGATDAGEVTPSIPADLPAGQYIVLLEDAPVATYDGGTPGLAPTAPDEGEKLDPNSSSAKKYSAHLAKKQKAVASAAGVQAEYSYTFTFNGFAADLSAAEANELSRMKGVQAMYPDELRHLDAVPSTEFLGLSGPGGVWESIGGVAEAGAGVVVGVIDSGIAPENPSFAGAPLGSSPSATEPYLDGNTVVFNKADGTQFKSVRVTGAQWGDDDYSTKLVGARYFNAGSALGGNTFSQDVVSPLDVDGHGSHTASTAAGNNDVAASVQGIDFGAISGVAPAAKVAAYKACWDGDDPTVTTDDGCWSSDTLAAIDAAVKDGVDVINYSIGGGAATTTLSTDDIAFFNAAAAGIFVAVSAGNDGPDASTADHASPWYTTVAASTIPTYEGTVTLPNGFEAAGASFTVPADEPVTGPVVYSGDVGLGGADAAKVAQCWLGTLDPAKVAGKIVVCDRGGSNRVDKSAEVAAKGGIGMILVNVTPGSLDNDFHSVPTVHIPHTVRTDLLDYVRTTPDATATLIGENITGVETPTPQIAGFSSRGPMLADGSDILKPDISAPGVGILAATADDGETPTWNFLSGTSMSSPHVAGIAALYLGERPNATPAEVKSAMMTTAYDTVDIEGAAAPDPFAQGAGHADPTRYFEPGLLYLNGPADWAAFLQGKGLVDFGIEPIDGSDLNLASIAIGELSGSQTVTRTVKATQAGTYTATVSGMDGIDVTVEPSSFTIAEGGEQTFTVTFANESAPAEEYATGFLTWTSGSTTVRSPMAVQPVTLDAPDHVSGEGITGSTDVTVISGINADMPLHLAGLAPVELQTNPDFPVPGHTGDQDSFYLEGTEYNNYFETSIPEGVSQTRLTLDTSDEDGLDLDLYVFLIDEEGNLVFVDQSATGSADEEIIWDDPEAGDYLLLVNRYAPVDAFTWDLTVTNLTLGEGEGAFTASPNPLPLVLGEEAVYTLSWTGLEPESTFAGLVRYADTGLYTLLTVETGAAAPVATKAPKITGDPKVGKKLTAHPGKWDPKDVEIAYQWLRDGEPIADATAAKYKVTRADAGTALSVRVTATAEGNPNPGTAVSNEVFVKFTSRMTLAMNRYVGTSSQKYVVTVKVTPSGGPAATGKVTVWVGSKKLTATLADGKAKIDLGKQSRGLKVVVGSYPGGATVSGASGATGFIVTR